MSIGRPAAIVFADSAGSVLPARLGAPRSKQCDAAFGQPRWDSYLAYDLDGARTSPEMPIVGLALLSDARWARDADGVMRADVFGDGARDEVRRCAAGEGEHFTLWDVKPDGRRLRRGQEYFDWGAFVEVTCKPGESAFEDP
jgi:hypothetical protein